jgi:hypothetical protein
VTLMDFIRSAADDCVNGSSGSPSRPKADPARIKALCKGWEAMTAEGPALSSFSSFCAGVRAYEESLREQGR